MNTKVKLLHTSDWHLGKRLDDFSRMEEQKAVLQEICEIAERENADAVLVSGDLFDTFNPPTEAVDLFYKTLKRLTNNGSRAVIAIAGNHDSPDRIEAPDPLARECGIIFAGYPNSMVVPFELESGLKVLQSDEGFLELQLPGTKIPLRILLTPYANEYRLRMYFGLENSEDELRAVLQKKWQNLAEKFCDEKGVNVLVTHLFMVKKGDKLPEEPEDEKPILHVGGAQVIYTENIPKQIQFTAIGHLHRMHQVDSEPCPVFYSGSPLSYSFAEANQKKYVLMIDLEPGETASVREIELARGKKLMRKRAEGLEEALQWLAENKDALVELTLVTETFLTALERRQLNAAHPGIVSIIPEVTNAANLTGSRQKQIDLSRSMEELFRDYFKHEKGQEPGVELMNLFTEILAENEQ
ncbi:MAG: exonuclease SbcCD subunit D [Draconibacterium sp.]|nr:exonuclease SbcCD subunit D [Draconibacterium sp.]